MLKKHMGVFLVLSALLVNSATAEAGFKFRDVLSDVLTSGKTTTTKKTVKASNKQFSLDGSYYTGRGDRNKQSRAEETIAIYTTRLEEAATVNWHFIGNGKGKFIYTLTDPNGQQIFNAYTSANATYDAFTVLDPGDYELKVNFVGSSSRPDGIYRFKANKRVIPTNVSSDLSFVDDAGYLSSGVEAINYFPANSRPNDLLHYYAFTVPYSRNVSIICKPYTTNTRHTLFDILNEDQVYINRLYSSGGNGQMLNLYLNPGKYYIRAKCEDRKGDVYGIRVD